MVGCSSTVLKYPTAVAACVRAHTAYVAALIIRWRSSAMYVEDDLFGARAFVRYVRVLSPSSKSSVRRSLFMSFVAICWLFPDLIFATSFTVLCLYLLL